MPRKPALKPVLDEVSAETPADLMTTYLGEIRSPQDPVLRTPIGVDVYKRLLSDDQAHSVFQQRRRAVVSREWDITPGGSGRADRMAADWLRETITAVGWDRVVDRMLYGLWYGYAVAELMYARDGQYVALDAIKVRDRRRFRFGLDGGLRLVTPSHPQGEIMPDAKFWWFSSGADTDDDPYGMGLGHYCYWPVQFKRQGVRWALQFLERFAMPTPVGKFPPGTDKNEQKKLLSALVALRNSGAIVIPETMGVEFKESARNGIDAYSPFIALMDKAVSKVILSQTMTTDDGSSQAQAKVHQGVAEDVQRGDSDLICGTFNSSVLGWLTEWNFPGAARPSIYYSFDEPEDLNALSERDERLHRIGIRRTEGGIARVYGDDYQRVEPPQTAEKPAPPPPSPPTPEFAETDVEDDDDPSGEDLYAAELRAAAGPVVDRWSKGLAQLLSRCETLEEYRDALLAEYAELPIDELAAIMGEALAAAEMVGRYQVQKPATKTASAVETTSAVEVPDAA